MLPSQCLAWAPVNNLQVKERVERVQLVCCHEPGSPALAE